MQTLKSIMSEQMLEETLSVLKEVLFPDINSLRECILEGESVYSSSTSAKSRFYDDTWLNCKLSKNGNSVHLDLYVTNSELQETFFLSYLFEGDVPMLVVSSEAFPTPIALAPQKMDTIRELNELLTGKSMLMSIS